MEVLVRPPPDSSPRQNHALLEEALCHSSYANEHRAERLSSNERLEFLGDSVLGFVTAEFLFAANCSAPSSRRTFKISSFDIAVSLLIDLTALKQQPFHEAYHTATAAVLSRGIRQISF